MSETHLDCSKYMAVKKEKGTVGKSFQGKTAASIKNIRFEATSQVGH